MDKMELLKECGVKLKLPVTVYMDALKYYTQALEELVKKGDFSLEVALSACFYLATKVNEENRRLRGI